jgi:hypothetical protein
MNEFLRHLFDPTPTVPPRGLRKDHRPWRKQVVSGLFHAARLIFGFCVMALVIAGMMWWTEPLSPKAPLAFLVGWWTLPVAVIVMLVTAHRWAPFSIAFFLGPGLWRAFGHFIIGPDPNSAIAMERASRFQAFEIVASCGITIALTWRFLRDRPAPTTFLDRCALTFFAVASLGQLLTAKHSPPFLLPSGIAALFVAWVAYSFRHAPRKARELPSSKSQLS